MSLSLTGKNIIILAANGFDENHITEMQRALTKIKVPYKIAAPEQGLVNGWQGNGWGHYFTVDAPIGTALGSDYDALVLIGGERGVAKLKTNPHARRIINHFLEADKPVAAIGAGVSLLALSPKSAGRGVSATADLNDELKAANIVVTDAAQTLDNNILSAAGGDVATWVTAALELFSAAEALSDEVEQAA